MLKERLERLGSGVHLWATRAEIDEYDAAWQLGRQDDITLKLIAEVALLHVKSGIKMQVNHVVQKGIGSYNGK